MPKTKNFYSKTKIGKNLQTIILQEIIIRTMIQKVQTGIILKTIISMIIWMIGMILNIMMKMNKDFKMNNFKEGIEGLEIK